MKKKTILFITSFDGIFRSVQDVVVKAVETMESFENKEFDYDMIMIDNFSRSSSTQQSLHLIQSADIIISNLSSLSLNAMYEIGLTHALQKPIILLINNRLQIPFNVNDYRYISYDSDNLNNEFLISKLSGIIEDAINHPENWIITEKTKTQHDKSKTVFVSYSHLDNEYLERLKVHLKPLERKGTLQLWSDTLILSGEKWKVEIEKALGKAVIAILLISADFLASDFIVNNELQPLLKNAEDKGTIIIPVIIKPCRFLREESISQFQAINDPSIPMCKLSEYEKEEIYEKLSQRIELALESE